MNASPFDIFFNEPRVSPRILAFATLLPLGIGCAKILGLTPDYAPDYADAVEGAAIRQVEGNQ